MGDMISGVASLAILAIFPVGFVALRAMCTHRGPDDLRRGNVCTFCGYSRQGLPLFHPCPECGRTPIPAWSARPRATAGGGLGNWWRTTARIFSNPDEFFRHDALAGPPHPSWNYLKRSHDIGAWGVGAFVAALGMGHNFDEEGRNGVFELLLIACLCAGAVYVVVWNLMTLANLMTAAAARFLARFRAPTVPPGAVTRVMNYHAGPGAVLFAAGIIAGIACIDVYSRRHDRALERMLAASNVLLWAGISAWLLVRINRAVRCVEGALK